MDYEKRYSDALKRARYYHSKDYMLINSAIENIFPELKESEDEITRKSLINFLKSPFVHENITDEKVAPWIAWLEKQKEPEDSGEISDGYHTFNELYKYRMLYNAAFFNLLPKDIVHKSKRHHDGEKCFGGGWFVVMANLPTGQISNHYELKDWDLFQIPEKEIADEWDGHTPQEAAERLHKYLFEKQDEQKPTDNIEPKFHPGDWIVGDEGTSKIIFKITQYEDEYGYELTSTTGYIAHFVSPDYVKSNYHLWTIEDAKEGDVLVHNSCPFIFMGIKDDIVQALEENLLEGTNPVNFGEPKIDKDYHPATKEQRVLLFAKMKEAGYGWDAEKKELKKMEVASKESEDEKIRKDIIAFLLSKNRYMTPNEDWDFHNKWLVWLEKQREKLDPDKVIGWLIANICDFEYYVNLFRKDFGL